MREADRRGAHERADRARSCTSPRRPSSPTAPTSCASSGCATASSSCATRSGAGSSKPDVPERRGYHRRACARRSTTSKPPSFPPKLPWINVAMLRMDQQLGRPVLIEFWDFCRPNSIRTLPYMTAWHERYEPDGLRVIGVHDSGFSSPRRIPTRCAMRSHGWRSPTRSWSTSSTRSGSLYGNLGWPARYLFNQDGKLFDYHYGEGGYEETELAIQELLGIERPTLEPLRPEDAPGRTARAAERRRRRTVQRPVRGGRRVGSARRQRHRVRQWARADRRSSRLLRARSRTTRSTAGELELTIGDGVRCYAVCFTPGLAR